MRCDFSGFSWAAEQFSEARQMLFTFSLLTLLFLTCSINFISASFPPKCDSTGHEHLRYMEQEGCEGGKVRWYCGWKQMAVVPLGDDTSLLRVFYTPVTLSRKS